MCLSSEGTGGGPLVSGFSQLYRRSSCWSQELSGSYFHTQMIGFVSGHQLDVRTNSYNGAGSLRMTKRCNGVVTPPLSQAGPLVRQGVTVEIGKGYCDRFSLFFFSHLSCDCILGILATTSRGSGSY